MQDAIAVSALVIWIVSVVGLFWKLPIFGRRRRYALLFGVLGTIALIAVTSAVTSAVKTPQERAWDAEMAQMRTANAGNHSSSQSEPALALTSATWVLTCNGECLALSGAITNAGSHDRKDPIIKCTFEGESGSVIGVKREKLYKIIPAGKTVRFRSLDMGVRPAQSNSYTCDVLTSSEG